MDDIFKQIGELEEVQAFLNGNEPAPTLPERGSAESRVREFLAAEYGPGWRTATVHSPLLPVGGMPTWVAWLPVTTGEFLLCHVTEGPESHFSASSPRFVGWDGVPAAKGAAEGGAVAEPEKSLLTEAICVGLIDAAFGQIAKVLRGTALPPEEKKYLVGQLQHARRHLHDALQRRRKNGKESES